ncbi:MAG: 4-phosphoerythronate dehydrogenase [Bacteroidales bacterium]|nr:4-phosphoerythronate dehydrogenase [Candidatus Hennigimonas equi]
MMNGRLKIVADSHIPFLEGVFSSSADVVFKDGGQICREDLRDADALLVRTRTRCDRTLLEGSNVKFIATATIGTDHIDMQWCASHGIMVCNAAGCNAGGVMQYVFTALYGVCAGKSISLAGKTLGIIGVGHVGSRVEQAARKLGFNVLLCDPPRAAKEGGEAFVGLEELLRHSDIVTMHTPLDASTKAMADRDFFSLMRSGAVFINASRGEVVDEDALVEASGSLGAVIIDTWAGEPHINAEVLEIADIATPHIAGYSLLGKINGTEMSVRALGRHFGITEFERFRVERKDEEVFCEMPSASLTQKELTDRLLAIYDVFGDDSALRSSVSSFETLRQNYELRKELKFI